MGAMMAKLEADRDMELNERQKLAEEIRAKQEEIERVKLDVDEKDEEARRMQEEMAEAKRQLEMSTAAMSEKMQEAREALLKELRANLEENKDETKATEADKQYQLLTEQGRDKFKTLRDIRSGNTKRRIDNFENM